MAEDDVPPQMRLVNFVSEDQLNEARRTRGARVEDGTAQRDRSLYEILKENKDKKDAEFNERFKHRPPKALDEDETEFLDKLEMSRKEYEQQMADEEEQQLRSFQAAVASQSSVIHELKETPSVPKIQDKNPIVGRKNPPRLHPSSMVIKVKKAKVENPPEETARDAKAHIGGQTEEHEKSGEPNPPGETAGDAKANIGSKTEEHVKTREPDGRKVELPWSLANNGLVAYSDESEDDD